MVLNIRPTWALFHIRVKLNIISRAAEIISKAIFISPFTETSMREWILESGEEAATLCRWCSPTCEVALSRSPGQVLRPCRTLLWVRDPCTAYLCVLRVEIEVCLFVFGASAPQWAMASSFTRFLDHTQRRATVGRTPLEE